MPANYIIKDYANDLRKAEIRIRGLEMTAEKAAEMGDIESYTKICKRITTEQLKIDFLSRKKTVAIVDEQKASFDEY